MRNPNWTRDELILALDLYVRHRPAVLGNTSAELMELSEILNRLSRTDGDRSPTHRNANGVAMELLNFRPLIRTTRRLARSVCIIPGGGDEEVWREFASDPVRLRQTAAAIRVALASRHATPTDSAEVDEPDRGTRRAVADAAASPAGA